MQHSIAFGVGPSHRPGTIRSNLVGERNATGNRWFATLTGITSALLSGPMWPSTLENRWGASSGGSRLCNRTDREKRLTTVSVPRQGRTAGA